MPPMTPEGGSLRYAGLPYQQKPKQPSPYIPPGAYPTPGGQIFGHGPVAEVDPTYTNPWTTPPADNPPASNPDIEKARGDWWIQNAADQAAAEQAQKKTSDSGAGRYDPSKDPFLNSLIGRSETDINTRKQRALEQKKQILLGFGSKELARSVLGDDPFVGTVSDDPFTSTSFLAGLGSNYFYDTRDATEQRNAENTFYGGGRLGQIARLGRDRLFKGAAQEQVVRGQLGSIDDAIAQAVTDWQQQIFNQSWQSYTNALPTGAAA